jgi:hypothetical protein
MRVRIILFGHQANTLASSPSRQSPLAHLLTSSRLAHFASTENLKFPAVPPSCSLRCQKPQIPRVFPSCSLAHLPTSSPLAPWGQVSNLPVPSRFSPHAHSRPPLAHFAPTQKTSNFPQFLPLAHLLTSFNLLTLPVTWWRQPLPARRGVGFPTCPCSFDDLHIDMHLHLHTSASGVFAQIACFCPVAHLLSPRAHLRCLDQAYMLVRRRSQKPFRQPRKADLQ